MTAEIINGKEIAEKIRKQVKEKIKKDKLKPGLAVVLVGENPASNIYLGMKTKACNEVGIYSETHRLRETTDQLKLMQLIDRLNQDKKIHGILVQLPLPKHIDEKMILEEILPHKDVDGFTPVNAGNLFIGNNMIVPATPRGIIKLIESTKINFEGKHAVVVGRSNIVGKPAAVLLLQKNCTVTICHSRTKELGKITKQADILIAAVGKPKLIKAEMVKKGAIVIDVGTSKIEGKLAGDVDFGGVKEVAGYITPVPGGVGPMTIACLLENTLECMKLAPR